MNIFKRLLFYIFILLSPLLIYFGISFVLLLFPSKEICQNKNSSVYIRHNLFHTDIFIDSKSIKNEYFEKFKDLTDGKKRGYLAFSWGERDFFLKTKRWDDLNISIASKALFLNTPSLMHIIHWYYLPKKNMVEIKLSLKCKERLIKSIMDSFRYKNSNLIPINESYGRYDKFYEATQSYNIFRTCNTWTGERLRDSGVKISFWTPLAFEVIYEFKDKDE